jgi:hypothetical protein
MRESPVRGRAIGTKRERGSCFIHLLFILSFFAFFGNSNFFNMLDVIIGRLEAVRERGARISATND